MTRSELLQRYKDERDILLQERDHQHDSKLYGYTSSWKLLDSKVVELEALIFAMENWRR
jgi:hypothetical protein